MEEEFEHIYQNKLSTILNLIKNNKDFFEESYDSKKHINNYFRRVLELSSFDNLIHNVYSFLNELPKNSIYSSTIYSYKELFYAQIGRLYPVNQWYIKEEDKSLDFQEKLFSVLTKLDLSIPDYHLKMLNQLIEEKNKKPDNGFFLGKTVSRLIAQNKKITLINTIENGLIDLKEKKIL
jgi:hypothetical protein